ncbi:hypothetical protein QR685DRAFT_509302 [Neurospora intermedia]|uniref:Secreted protein n=1 Tax=Neurospora intermedia TaxID=5142 RepID=A0ABR3DNM4_NEUIN
MLISILLLACLLAASSTKMGSRHGKTRKRREHTQPPHTRLIWISFLAPFPHGLVQSALSMPNRAQCTHEGAHRIWTK